MKEAIPEGTEVGRMLLKCPTGLSGETLSEHSRLLEPVDEKQIQIHNKITDPYGY